MSLRSEELKILKLATAKQTKDVQAFFKRQKDRERLAKLRRSARGVKQSDENSASIPDEFGILSPPTTPTVRASRSTHFFGTPPKLKLPSAEKLARSRVLTRSQRKQTAKTQGAKSQAKPATTFQESDEDPAPPRRPGGDGKKPPPSGRAPRVSGKRKKKSESDTSSDEKLEEDEPPPSIRTSRQKRLWRLKQKKKKEALLKLQKGTKLTEAKRKAHEKAFQTKKGKIHHARLRHEAAITRARLHKQQQAEYRKTKREARQHYAGLGVKEARLQIKEEGPGLFSVRSTGMSAKVQKHIKLLLNRVKGTISVNGQSMSKQKAYTVIVDILSKQGVAQVKIVN